MNPFRQQIGIYYRNRSWAEDILIRLARDLACEGGAARICKDFIILNGGDMVKILPANDASRGYRFTKSFIQVGVPRDAYENIIAPKNLWNECYVIRDYEGLSYSGWQCKADMYYRGLGYVEEHFDEYQLELAERIHNEQL